jgi:hypothetical protein
MSPKNPSFPVGLAALGVCGMAMWRVAALAETPAPGSPPPAAPAASAPSQTQSVLLLTNGRVVQGMLSEDDSNYILRQKVGVIRFPKREVEKIFGSLQAIYQYKLSRLAQDDPDEHMKLAKWCMPLNMYAEARAELRTVSALSPHNNEAEAMLANLDAKAERAARPPLDPGVTQASASAATLDRDSPGELSPTTLPTRRRGTAALGLPVIFDLPPAVAATRAQEFARFVHPELQRHCAKCHNERSAIPFQLIQTKSQRDYADEMLVRTNLEATLRLVDAANLAQSPLLTNALMPHKPNNQPILSSPKARAYLTFDTWVRSLKPPVVLSGPAPAVSGSTSASTGFATERAAAPNPGAPYTPTALAPGTLPPMTPKSAAPQAPGMFVSGSYAGTEPYVPESSNFPVPFTLSGNNSLPSPQQYQPATTPQAPGMVPANNPASSAAGQAAPREVPYAHGTFQPAPGAPPLPVSIPKPGDSSEKAKAKPDKPSQIDPSLLEKFYSKRNNQ